MKDFRDQSRAAHANRIDGIKRAEGGRVTDGMMSSNPEIRKAQQGGIDAKQGKGREVQPTDLYTPDQIKTLESQFAPPRLDRPARAKGGKVKTAC